MSRPITYRSPARLSPLHPPPGVFTLVELGLVVLLFCFLVLSVARAPSSDLELQITQSVQAFHPPWLDLVMWWTSAVGFFPLVVMWIAAVIALLVVLGYRWEAACIFFAGAGNAVLETLVKYWVVRPRPSPDLVHVVRQLNGLKESFPAGHVMGNVAIMGFLIYLCWTLARPSVLRTLAVVFLSSQIVLIGASRLYEGEHWFTDVLGGYLLGILLLAATYYVYEWGRAHRASLTRRRAGT